MIDAMKSVMQYRKIEHCPTCFQIKGKGFFNRWQVKKFFKEQGHILFNQEKKDGHWVLTLSTKQYFQQQSKG